MTHPRRAPRTTPTQDGVIAVDSTRTFLMEGAFIEAMIALGEDGRRVPVVRLDLNGRWNHGAADTPVLITGIDCAREVGAVLISAAQAAERDASSEHRDLRYAAALMAEVAAGFLRDAQGTLMRISPDQSRDDQAQLEAGLEAVAGMADELVRSMKETPDAQEG